MKKYILIILSISSLINILEASEQTLSTPPQSRDLGEDAGFNSKTFNPSQTQPPMPSKAYTSSTLIQNQKDNNHKKTGYFDDLGTALISESTDKAIKTFTHSSIKTPVKTGKKVVGEFNDSYQETNPNATRDAFINAAIKTYIVTATTIACPLAGAILFGSKISDIHDKHYDPLKNLPPLEADDYVDRFIANNIASSLFNCGAMPYRTVNAVAHYMVKKSINAADRDGITDERIAQVLKEKQGAILQVASNVDTYFKKAPTTIARLYKEFSTTSPQPTEEEKINAARTRIQKDFQQAKERYAGNDLFEAPLANSSIDNGTLPLEQELTAADKEFIAQLITTQTQETQKQIAGLTCKLISLNNDQLNQQEKERIKEEINYAGNCAKATGDGLAVLAFMAGDRQSARKLKAFGTESQKCITSMALMPTNPVLGTIGVASSICNLIEAFEDQEEDTFREEMREMIRSIHLAIQEAVKTLSELIKNCTYEIIGEIYNVKQLIGEQHANIMQEFFKLHQSQSDTLKQMNILYSNLIKGQDFAGQHAHQEYHLTAQRHEEIGGLFAELPVRHIDLEYHDLNAQKKQGLYSYLLLKIITKYHSFINVLATSSSLTGSYIAQDNLQRMADALQGSLETRLLSKHPVFGHIDLLIHMHEKFSTRTLTDDLKTGIANPLVLIKCVKQLTNLISDFTESQQSTFISEQDKETCIKMLSDIAHELERNQQVIQWLVDPKSSTTLLSEYKKATEQLKRVLNEHNKEHFETRIRTEMKDRLRSIAQAELATLSYMIPPAFPKLKAQLIDFDASMHTVIKSIQDNYWSSSWHPFISRSTKLQYEQYAIRCDFSNSLKEVPGIEEDARRDDFISYIDHIIESKKMHLERIRKDIKQKIEDKLKQNMMHIDTLDFNNLSWMPTVIHSIVYPAQKDKFHLPLFLPNTLDAPQQIKTMIATGKATLTYTYNVVGKEIVVSGHLHYNDTKEEVYKWVSSEHTEVIENDEDLYNFIYGGRYAHPNDTITVYHGPGTPEYDAWEGCDCLETRSFVNTHRYPSLVEHPGLYTKNTGFMARQLHEDMSKNLTHKNAIDTYLKEKLSEQSRMAVQMLDDHTTELGKAGNKLNIFYALLASSLAMHDGKLEPHATITQSTDTEARNSQELRTLLRDKPTQVPAALTTLSALTTQPVTFNGTHKLLIKQTDYLEKIHTALKKITQTPVHIPAAPKSLASALPEEFMKEISARFTTLETENRELKEQNTQVLAQNAQILALLMALNEKK